MNLAEPLPVAVDSPKTGNAGEATIKADDIEVPLTPSAAVRTPSPRPSLAPTPTTPVSSVENARLRPLITPSLPESVDVVIVGAGLSGLTLACELAKRGTSFVIVDALPTPSTQTRSTILHSRSLEILFDLSLTDKLLAVGKIIHGARAVVSGKPTFSFSFESLDSQFPYALAIDQPTVERMLTEQLQLLGGKQVYRGLVVCRLGLDSSESPPSPSPDLLGQGDASPTTSPLGMSPIWDLSPSVATRVSNRGCTVEMKVVDTTSGKLRDEIRSTIKCGWVVGCDGARSSIRQAMGVEFESRTVPTEYLVADVAVEWGPSMDSPSVDEVVLVHSAQGVMMCIPLAADRWRVICSRDCPTDMPTGGWEPYSRLTPPEFAELEQILSTLVPASTLTQVYWTVAFAVNSRISSKFVKNRAILVGDAAHVHPPTWSQGANSGIQDAYNLGWKLAAVANDGAHSRLLDSFEVERREAADSMIRLAFGHKSGCCVSLDQLTKGGMTSRCFLSSVAPVLSQIDKITRQLTHQLSQLSLGYTTSPIVGQYNLTGIRPGSRVPHIRVMGLSKKRPNGQEDPPVVQFLSQYIAGGHTTLILQFGLNSDAPASAFSCYKKDSRRWNSHGLRLLSRFSRLVNESFKFSHDKFGTTVTPLRILWVISSQSPDRSNLIALDTSIPDVLRRYLRDSVAPSVPVSVVFDVDSSVLSTFGITKSEGAFVVCRPDGHLSFHGYVADPNAVGEVVDHFLEYFRARDV